MARAHVIGAGLAGLAAALRLADAGFAVTVYEASGHAGGRCRSFFDETLGLTIDNGNHLLLSGNRAAMAYLDLVGARASLAGPDEARFDFLDLASGERWSVKPNAGPLPWWIFDSTRRIPDTTATDYLTALKLLFTADDATVAQCVGDREPLFTRFWEPLAVAVLNAPADRAAARLLVPVLLKTFGRGEAACRPLIARDSLAASLVDPALAKLRAKASDIRFGVRLAAFDMAQTSIRGLVFNRGREAVEPDDLVILALPPVGAQAVMPSLVVPDGSYPIVNVHFRLDPPATENPEPELLGLVGGAAHWLFLRQSIASVTISAAETLAQAPLNEVAGRVWQDVARALGRKGPVPPYRVVKERRATFAQEPRALGQRPQARTQFANLFLAGDWTQTGLPATIEGAIWSGFRAAKLAINRAGGSAKTNERNSPVSQGSRLSSA